ncbi:hypothetical protein C1645_819744 [Glomus cerebriforme]|uniref:HAT C-terminal dimerisation domain-containing protein n=1 Tax=Glomus cerebriforme TaxID=658196 RepID=A0A397TAC4_9GLOM|nr:hypothetical protein C1645_819744 [Glomus cerebriforme]
MLMEIIKTIKPNSLDNQDSYNIDKQEEDVFEGEEQNLISNDDINEPVITFGLLDKQEKEKYQREIGTSDLPNQSQKKSLMEWLTKDNAGVLDEIKYLAVSATSTASERLFSDAGNLLTNKRTHLKPNLFKKIGFKAKCMNNLVSIYES